VSKAPRRTPASEYRKGPPDPAVEAGVKATIAKIRQLIHDEERYMESRVRRFIPDFQWGNTRDMTRLFSRLAMQFGGKPEEYFAGITTHELAGYIDALGDGIVPPADGELWITGKRAAEIADCPHQGTITRSAIRDNGKTGNDRRFYLPAVNDWIIERNRREQAKGESRIDD
jgi:hypothetical protein